MNNKKWHTVIEKRLNGIIYTGMTEYTNNPNDLLRRAKYAFPQYQKMCNRKWCLVSRPGGYK